jgi:hypothetical protein
MEISCKNIASMEERPQLVDVRGYSARSVHLGD